jgi:hypothetical protein
MDHSVSQSAIEETFTLGNIAPQLARFNQGPWQQLEQFALQVSKLYEEVVILTGPLFLAAEATIPADRIPSTLAARALNADRDASHSNSSGPTLSFVRHAVLGDAPNTVAVPTHFFKVILARRPVAQSGTEAQPRPIQHDTAIAAFVLPHSEAIPGGICDLGMYTVSLRQLEQAMGGLLFERALCGDAKRLLDEQAAGRGLGAGVRFAAWAMAQGAFSAPTPHSNGPTGDVTIVEKAPDAALVAGGNSLASPLPVASLALRDPHTPTLPPTHTPTLPPTLPHPRPDALRAAPLRWRKRRSKQADNPVSAAACMREQLRRQQQVQADTPNDEAQSYVDMSALDSDLATELGEVVHLCSVVQCAAPKRLKQANGAPGGRMRARVRWRASDEHDYNRQWLDRIMVQREASRKRV